MKINKKEKKYWVDFYNKNIAPNNNSEFSKFTLNWLKTNVDVKRIKLLDVACGNGRDTNFFIDSDINSIGLDLASNESENIIKGDILDFNYDDYNVLYLRFIIHSLSEDELDVLIDNIIKSNIDRLIFIETRSTKGIIDSEKSETNFKSSIGDKHFRMLYSEEYLTNKLKQHFKIKYIDENNNLAIYKDDNPYCIRYILKQDKNEK